MTTWSHDEQYSVQIFFFGFIINSIVSINLEKSQKLSKLIILSRIVHVIHQYKSAVTSNFCRVSGAYCGLPYKYFLWQFDPTS